MGFAITWFAVKESNAEDLLKRLDLRPNGKAEDMPKSLISTAKMKTGWRVLWYGHYTCPFLAEKDLVDISTAYDIIICLVDEQVMFSSSELWSQGKRKWHLSHAKAKSLKHLSTIGDPPNCFYLVWGEMQRQQEAEGGEDAMVDYIFDIPLRVAKDIVGFKHCNNTHHLIDGKFIVLERPNKEENSFAKWSRGFCS